MEAFFLLKERSRTSRSHLFPHKAKSTETTSESSSWTNGWFLLDQRWVPLGPTLQSSPPPLYPISSSFLAFLSRNIYVDKTMARTLSNCMRFKSDGEIRKSNTPQSMKFRLKSSPSNESTCSNIFQSSNGLSHVSQGRCVGNAKSACSSVYDGYSKSAGRSGLPQKRHKLRSDRWLSLSTHIHSPNHCLSYRHTGSRLQNICIYFSTS